MEPPLDTHLEPVYKRNHDDASQSRIYPNNASNPGAGYPYVSPWISPFDDTLGLRLRGFCFVAMFEMFGC